MCEYCEIKKKKHKYDENIYYYIYEGKKMLVHSAYIFISKNKNKQYILTDPDDIVQDCIIKFCPMCGRKLNE